MKGTAEVKIQMANSKTEAKREAKDSLLRLCGENGVKPKSISYNCWEQQVGGFTYYYCTASAEVF